MDADQLRDNNPKATQEVYNDIPEPTGQAEPESTSQEVATQEPEVSEQAPTAEETQDEGSHSARQRIIEQSKQISGLTNTVDELSGLAQLGNPILPALDLKPGEEISPEDYDKHVTQKANALIDIRLAAERNANRIKDELREAVVEYPELNPKAKDNFDSDLSDSISEATRSFIRSNPTGNVKKFVDNLMKPYRRSVDKGVANQQAAAVKQASQTALRPTQVVKADKEFKDLSIKEMETKLGFVK